MKEEEEHDRGWGQRGGTTRRDMGKERRIFLFRSIKS
jgi:hypothetical protein